MIGWEYQQPIPFELTPRCKPIPPVENSSTETNTSTSRLGHLRSNVANDINQMKTRTTKNILLRASLTLAVMMAVHAPASSWAVEPAGKEMKMEGKMMDRCEEMKKEKQKMQADMKAQDAALAAAVATMNNALQEKKVDLLAGVVTTLVEQRSAMNVKKAEMEERMMKHMMAHMEMGKESMSKCPMMKDMDDQSDAAHAEHHEKPE